MVSKILISDAYSRGRLIITGRSSSKVMFDHGLSVIGRYAILINGYYWCYYKGTRTIERRREHCYRSTLLSHISLYLFNSFERLSYVCRVILNLNSLPMLTEIQRLSLLRIFLIRGCEKQVEILIL